MSCKVVVAIDGPAGSGKSTIARLLAQKLGLLYIDTGAMYRAATLKALRSGVDPTDGKALGEMLENTRIELGETNGKQWVRLDGDDVTLAIRSPEVGSLVSVVSGHPEVRSQMTREQRRLAQSGGVVLDGRDIGTHVLPGADVKFYFTADLEVRVDRRLKENHEKGFHTDRESVKREMIERDRLDSARKCAPLRVADDAVVIDTSHLTISEVLSLVEGYVRGRTG